MRQFLQVPISPRKRKVILFLMEVTGKAAPTLKKETINSEKWLALQKKGCHTGHEKCVSARRCTYQQHQYHLRDDCRTRSYPETLFSGREKRQYAPASRTGIVTGYLLVLQNAHLIDQTYSIRACGVRQRHIDQAQSMNIYITNDSPCVRFSTCI